MSKNRGSDKFSAFARRWHLFEEAEICASYFASITQRLIALGEMTDHLSGGNFEGDLQAVRSLISATPAALDENDYVVTEFRERLISGLSVIESALPSLARPRKTVVAEINSMLAHVRLEAFAVESFFASLVTMLGDDE
ncbi:hypothetical protein [Rhizobium sp. NZLR1]|uniref:hypothetical protein n=1 Tax=Rhizobium sp. NZLR1 TaxID=2731096 RepID=UPI001A998A0B|nr:hypothetical protein [Rhizobium sp. NZLR1]MBX5201026.1 hypothetical protein [Rhizobium sp. NZLR1]QSZ21543.1 hypothetical protein J3O30_02950 [Rhizobium sp. NZLR1]